MAACNMMCTDCRILWTRKFKSSNGSYYQPEGKCLYASQQQILAKNPHDTNIKIFENFELGCFET